MKNIDIVPYYKLGSLMPQEFQIHFGYKETKQVVELTLEEFEDLRMKMKETISVENKKVKTLKAKLEKELKGYV